MRLRHHALIGRRIGWQNARRRRRRVTHFEFGRFGVAIARAFFTASSACFNKARASLRKTRPASVRLTDFAVRSRNRIRSHLRDRESAGSAPVGRREVSMRRARHFPFPRPPRSSADAEAPQRFSITAQDAEARNILFAESGISFCLAKRTSLRYWNFYETHSRNVARRRCAVPDDALDRRLAGREGRFARSCAESARHFLRSLLATALHIPPSSWLFARGRARYRPGFFRTST